MPVGYHFLFFFNDTATTEIYTLSLHDALPIFAMWAVDALRAAGLEPVVVAKADTPLPPLDVPVWNDEPARSEEHTLNSSHANISYAVFCLKKKKTCIDTSATDASLLFDSSW